MPAEQFNYENILQAQFNLTSNLATEAELNQQAKIALRAYREADNGDNELNFDELRVLMQNLGLPLENDEEKALAGMDTDGTGTLSVEEWLIWWLKRVGQSPNPAKQMGALAKYTFQQFDVDSSGAIDRQELRQLISSLGADFTDNELNAAIYELDSDGSGSIECNEFVEWWANRASKTRQSSSLISLKLRKLASKAMATFYTDIFTAAWNGNIDLVSTFLDGDRRQALAQDVSEFGDGWTALHYAAYQGHLEIVKKLLEATPSKAKLLDKQNAIGFTALFYAAQRDRVQVAAYLLEEGANPCLFGVPYPEEQPDLFVCPAHLAVDSPELHALLKSNSRCLPPGQVPIEKFPECSIDGAAPRLEFAIPADVVARVSSLPIKEYKIELVIEASDEEAKQGKVQAPAARFQVPSSKPKCNTQVQLDLSRSWLSSCEGQSKIMMRIAAVNALGDVGPISAPKQIVYILVLSASKSQTHKANIADAASKEVEEIAGDGVKELKQNTVSKDKKSSAPASGSRAVKEPMTTMPVPKITKKSPYLKMAATSPPAAGTAATPEAPAPHAARESEFSFADMIAADEAAKSASAAKAAVAEVAEGGFSFADMIAADEAKKAAKLGQLGAVEPLERPVKTKKAKSPRASAEAASLQEGEFSFADMIAADEAKKAAKLGQLGTVEPLERPVKTKKPKKTPVQELSTGTSQDAALQEGEFSFADMISADEATKAAKAPTGAAPARGGRTYRQA